jgi:hypothetical protein
VAVKHDWEAVREKIKIAAEQRLGYYEFKKHKEWFNEGCSELLDQRKQAKLQWLQDQSEINADNLNKTEREASRYSYFRNKKKEFMKRQNR